MIVPELEPLADNALMLRLGNEIDPAINAEIMQLAARIRAAEFPWLLDLVPAYASLAVFFDCSAFGRDAHARVGAMLIEACSAISDAEVVVTGHLHEIPVYYGGESGPDIDDCARELGLTRDEIIARHCAPEYRVAMIGFAPGFPYLLGLHPSLSVPRLATPRTHVPAGSVAIGGAQTGVYPRDSAGGWRLIGRTPRSLFDSGRQRPSLLQAGDRVRFVAMEDDVTMRWTTQ